ncbi:hypothetical protein [Marinilabilia sp.]
MIFRYSMLVFFQGIFVLIGVDTAFCQEFGLEFKGQEFTPDQRTGLNLTPDEYFKFEDEFEISFSLKMRSNVPRNFGYIMRVLDSEGNNVDLIAKKDPEASNLLSLVNSLNDSLITFYLGEKKRWTNYRIKFLLQDDRLVFYTPDTFYVQKNVRFKNSGFYQIVLGANKLDNIKTTDVPSMMVKNIVINEKGKRKFFWKLDEEEGVILKDELKEERAIVKNPIWLKRKHQNWKRELEMEVNGGCLVTANMGANEIYLVSDEFLLRYSIKDNNATKIKYKNKPNLRLVDRQAFFNTKDHLIYVYDIDSQRFFTLNSKTGVWEGEKVRTPLETNYLHHNKYYDAQDGCLYLFGGYGQHTYKNTVYKVDPSSNEWEVIKPKTDVFNPRYLAGLGVTKDTLYILGGYGSLSGDQMVNPGNYYDLISYSPEDDEFKNKFKVPDLVDDMCVANTMFVDAVNRNYYALVYEKNTYNDYLQLIKGDLDSPVLTLMGNRIPYTFMDIHSYSDLFFSSEKEALYAFTSHFDNKKDSSNISLYSIGFPPNEAGAGPRGEKEASYFWVYVISFFVLLGSLIVVVLYNTRKSEPLARANEKLSEKAVEFSDNDSSGLLLHQSANKLKYNVVFFGGFQVFDSENVDVTNRFTPLLKELFLLIFLYTYKNNKGIPSDKLTQILWPDKSEKSAKNNRAVNIAKLRTVLGDLNAFELTSATGYWKINITDTDKTSDYVDFLNITESKINLNKPKVFKLMSIIKKGGFLADVDYYWLDDFKSDVSDKIIESLITISDSYDIKKEADSIVHLADCIFNFDMVNEEALILKCKALYYQGRHSLAKDSYDKFVRHYKELYAEDYNQSFNDLVKH